MCFEIKKKKNLADSLALRDTQTVGIHEVLEGALGLMGRLRTRSAIWKVFRESSIANQKDGMKHDLFSCFECFHLKQRSSNVTF